MSCVFVCIHIYARAFAWERSVDYLKRENSQ